MSSSALNIGHNPRSLYYFFTRLLPGLIILLGVGLISPREFVLSLPLGSILLIGILLSFVAGQIIHSLAAAMERTVPFTKPHREHAYHLIETMHAELDPNCDDRSDLRSQLFRRALAEEYELRFDNEEQVLDPEGLYVLLRSRIELDGRGRTLQYQALIMFNRNLGSSLFILGLFLLSSLHPRLAYSPIMPKLPEALLLGIVALLGVTGFGLIVRNEYYKRLYAHYLVLDFCNLVGMTDRSHGS